MCTNVVRRTSKRPAPVPACVIDPDLFASTDVVDHRKAAAYCGTCPALTGCREQLELDQRLRTNDKLAHLGTWAGQLFTSSGRKDPT